MSSNNCSPCSAQQSEDLKYFEERLQNNLTAVSPRARKWKVVFLCSIAFAVFSLLRWWNRFNHDQDSILGSMLSEFSLVLSVLVLVALLLLGAHQRSRAPNIIADRVRQVLKDYNMSVDNAGRIILLPSKPPPTNGR